VVTELTEVSSEVGRQNTPPTIDPPQVPWILKDLPGIVPEDASDEVIWLSRRYKSVAVILHIHREHIQR
jgi:hypothetical protein